MLIDTKKAPYHSTLGTRIHYKKKLCLSKHKCVFILQQKTLLEIKNLATLGAQPLSSFLHENEKFSCRQ